MVECNLPKVEVAGSSPVSRSPPDRSAALAVQSTGAASRPVTSDVWTSSPPLPRLSAVRARRLASIRACGVATDTEQAAALARTTPGGTC